MAELRIERDHPGHTARHWRDGDIVIVQLGRDLDQLTQRRVIRDAMREHGIRRHRRGILPVLPIPTGLRDAVRDHPTTTAAVTGIVATSVAVGALLGTTLPGDDPRQHRRGRRPPAVAGPSPTHGPTSRAVPRPRQSTARVSPAPAREDPEDRPAVTPVREAAPSPSPAPTGTRPDEPTTPTPKPAPPPTPARCLLRLDAPGLAAVRLLCTR